MIGKIGVQLYTVRTCMNGESEIASTFERLKKLGYDAIQTPGPLDGISYQRFGELAKEHGLEICSTFDDLEQMKQDPEAAIAKHRAIGTDTMGICFSGVVKDGVLGFYQMDDVEKAISDFRMAASNIIPAGFHLTYHNHGHEFCKFGGKTVLRHFMDETPPEELSFCLDTYWTQLGGADILQYIRDLGSRLDILHLKDCGRTAAAPYTAVIGDGNLNWPAILDAAQQAGVKYYIVEQDDTQGEDPFDALARSREYLEKF